PVHLRDRDRAPLLPRQPGGPAGPLRRRRGLLRAAARGRLGVGHLPIEPLRALRARGDLQGRQHRGAQQAGQLRPLTACGVPPTLNRVPWSPKSPRRPRTAMKPVALATLTASRRAPDPPSDPAPDPPPEPPPAPPRIRPRPVRSPRPRPAG